jgi:hypothetical protein
MQELFAVPWLTRCRRTLLSFAVAVILVFSIFALMKTSGGEKQAPAQELLTGSIQRSPTVRKSPSNDPMAAFLTPALTQPSHQPMQSAVVEPGVVPLPRPRPKRLGTESSLPMRLRASN